MTKTEVEILKELNFKYDNLKNQYISLYQRVFDAKFIKEESGVLSFESERNKPTKIIVNMPLHGVIEELNDLMITGIANDSVFKVKRVITKKEEVEKMLNDRVDGCVKYE